MNNTPNSMNISIMCLKCYTVIFLKLQKIVTCVRLNLSIDTWKTINNVAAILCKINECLVIMWQTCYLFIRLLALFNCLLFTFLFSC